MQQGFPPLYKPGQGHLFFIGEQIDSADVLEIKPQQIRGAGAAAIQGLPCPSGLAWQRNKSEDSDFKIPRGSVECDKYSESFRDLSRFSWLSPPLRRGPPRC